MAISYTAKDWATGNAITEADLDRMETGIGATVTRINAIDADDSGWLTSGITAATGWSITSQKYRKMRGVVALYVVVSRTGADITPSTIGDTTNAKVCTLPANYRTTTDYQVLTSGGAGRTASFYTDTAGDTLLASTTPGASVATGDSLSFGGTIIV